MATSVLEREMRRRIRRGEGPQPLEPSAPGVPPTPRLVALEALKRGLPQPPAPGLFSNLNAAPQAPVPVPAAPGVPPAPANIPAPQQAAPTQLMNRAPQAPAPAPARPDPAMMARPSGAAMGLQNYAGDEFSTQMAIENWRNNQAASQSTALQPTVAPYPMEGFGPKGAVLPTGEQYPTVWGRPDPEGVFDPRDPAPAWMGNVPRAMVNFLPGVTNELMQGLGEAGKTAIGIPIEAARQAFTSSGERAREDQAAQAAEAAITQQPAPAARRYTLQQNAGEVPAAPTSAGVPTVADLTPGQPVPGTIDAAGAQAPAAAPAAPIANVGAWNTLPPAALEMAQVWQSRGWSPNAIAGMLGQAAGESSFIPGQTGDSGASTGMFQHQGPRRVARDKYAQYYGLDPNDPSTEAMFVDAEMRGDPAAGIAPTEAYAWQQLQAATDPRSAAAAGLHFERPQGYSGRAGQFNPEAVHGWANRLRGAEQTAALLSGRPLPPFQEPWREAQAPLLPNPVDRPIPAAPDYSSMNAWLDTARPQPTDPAAQRQRMFNEILSGIAQGNAAVDTRGAGGVGRLIAAWGKGATGGKAYSDAQSLREQEEYKRALEGYGMDRAGFAQTEENANVNWNNLRDETMFSNLTDEQVVDVKNQQGQFATTERNRQRQAEADQVNEENIYKWTQDALEAGQSQTHIGPYGVTTVHPDGRVDFQRTRPEPGGEAADPLKRLKLLEGLEGPAGKVAQYANLSQLAVDSGNDRLVTDEIMKDVFAGGYGKGVFPKEYDEIAQAERKAVDTAYPYLQLQKPAEYATMVDQAVKNRMMEIVAQPGASHEWIQRAAGLGVTGAQVFLQLAHPEEVE